MALKLTVLVILGSVLYEQHTSGLMSLDFRGKDLKTVPEYITAVKAGKISLIYLTNNSITHVKDCAFCLYTRLTDLLINQNRLIYVSPSAFNRTVIKNLNLDYNNLACVPDLSAIHKTLMFINMRGNRLHSCDKVLVSETKLNKLHTVNLGKNRLTDISSMSIFHLAPNLKHVYLGSNRLKKVQDFLQLLPRLETFYLTNNLISCSCQVAWLKKVKRDGLGMMCRKFGILSGKTWNSLSYKDLSNHCDVSPAVTTLGFSASDIGL